MNKPVTERVIDVIEAVVQRKISNRTVTLAEIGVDSLDVVEIAMELDAEFSIDLEDGCVEAWRTVMDIIQDVHNALPQPHPVDVLKDCAGITGEDTPELAEMRAICDEPVPHIDLYAARIKALISDESVEVQPKAMNRIDRKDVDAFKYLNAHSVEFNSLDRYQEIATCSAIYPGHGTPLGLQYVALKMNGEAGELAEHIGKAMRDDNWIELRRGADGVYSTIFNPLTDERRALIIKEIGDVLWYLSAACNELGISLSHAAAENLEKLCDRGERNALRGSGDER